jgi:hypothetical protein
MSPLKSLLTATILAPAIAHAAPPTDPPLPQYHLTPRPWSPLTNKKSEILDKVEGLVRFSQKHQDATGAIIDPFLKKEHQYATPYYAHALGVLLKNNRANELRDSGIKAMDWATHCFETNNASGHRVFYIHALVENLTLYKSHVSKETLATWKNRLKAKIDPSESKTYNWGTYLMLGDWLRYKAGLLERQPVVDLIEENWKKNQRPRIVDTPLNLYHDTTSDPDTLAVEAVGRTNLLALIHHGYDGPSAKEITTAVEAGTKSSLLLMDPSGQMPTNGRTDNHVWADVGYQLSFEIMANRAWAKGDKQLAGQFRRAAQLTFNQLERWRRTDDPFAGSYFVTKNHFDPQLRLGYQKASQYSNYNGSLMHHLAEAHELLNPDIPQQPAPVEIGGYAFQLDDKFATAFANAGGMQLQFNLRADTELSSGNPNYWNALGLVRIGKTNWDTRLGPADGIRAGDTNLGVSFAPTFEEDGKWIRLASVPDRYEGKFSVQFQNPALVRCTVDYLPRQGKTGPSFRHAFTITPTGVLTTLTRTAGKEKFGVTLPLLTNDGRPLEISAKDRIATSRYSSKTDDQNFIALNPDATFTTEPAIRSTYGDLTPIRATTKDDKLQIFIYPRNSTDPPATEIRDKLKPDALAFPASTGIFLDELYQGPTCVGGTVQSIAIGGGILNFANPSGFVAQLENGKLTATETDRNVTATFGETTIEFKAFTPMCDFPANPEPNPIDSKNR